MQALTLILPIFSLPLSSSLAHLWTLLSRVWNRAWWCDHLACSFVSNFCLIPLPKDTHSVSGRLTLRASSEMKRRNWSSEVQLSTLVWEMQEFMVVHKAIRQECPSSHFHLYPSSTFPSHGVYSILILIKRQPLFAALLPQEVTPTTTLYLSLV